MRVQESSNINRPQFKGIVSILPGKNGVFTLNQAFWV